MARLLAALFALGFFAVFLATQAAAGDARTRIGYGLLITNDVFGDTHDRWRTGSFASSLVLGAPSHAEALPERLGALLEIRFNGEVIAPENLANPAPADRPYAQALSLGLHSHFQRSGVEYALGADLVFTGPMVGLDHLQERLHDITGGRDASPAVKAAQIGNDVKPSGVFEMGRSFTVGPNARLRPFFEARAGVETLARVGADLTIGGLGQGGLMVRAPVSGHRFVAVGGAPRPGLSMVLGADIARVGDSAYFRSAGPARLEETRTRARAGLSWQTRRGASLFYGLTWLDKEFTTQREAQVIGSAQLRLRF
ncbi:MAG: DUF2219 family protein [Roseovarius sp.]